MIDANVDKPTIQFCYNIAVEDAMGLSLPLKAALKHICLIGVCFKAFIARSMQNM